MPTQIPLRPPLNLQKTFASLFTGGGLADIGAMQAGCELLWGVELDADIAAIANQNLPHRDRVHVASVIGFDWSSVERPDHLHMSPPCQDFSVAKTTGKKANPNDDIANACIEAIQALQPSSITLENVEGYRKAKGFQKIVDTLWGLGYWVNVDVLNAADFGVPQTRRRLILRAVHGGFPAPLPPKEPWCGWYEAISDLIPTLPETQFAEWQIKRLKAAAEKGQLSLDTSVFVGGSNNSQSFLDYAIKNRPSIPGVRAYNQVAPTIPSDSATCAKAKAFVANGTAHLVPGGNASSFSVRDGKQPSRTVESTERVGNLPRALLLNSAFPQSNGKKHYTDDEVSFTVDTTSLGRMKASAQGRVVRMTPRALARFQTVPDWYELPSKNQLACKIIGNGVPCLMMQKILESLC